MFVVVVVVALVVEFICRSLLFPVSYVDRSERSTPGSPVNTSPGLGVYMFTRNTDAPTALETSTTTPDNSSENFHATLNTSATPTTTPRDDESFPHVTISDTPGDGDVDGETENHGDGEIENNEGNFVVRRAANGQHRQRSVPGFQVRRTRDIDNVRRTLDFHLRQVIAPSNDVLKRMVPVIVFAIVQGLDEFRDSVPTFIDRFKKLKRLLLVDMVESVTVHMREHQIKQVREQRLGGRVGDENSEATDQAGNTTAGDSDPQKQNPQERDESGAVKFSSAEDEDLAQWAQRNENMNNSSHARDRGDRGKRIITVEDELPTERNSLSDGSTEVAEPSTASSPCVESSHRHFSSSTPNLMQSSNDNSGLHQHSCENCKEFQMRYPFAVCQNCLVESRSSFVATSTDAGPSPVEGESATQLAMGKFMGNQTCQDDSVKKWLSGKRSLAGPEEPSSSSTEPKYSVEIDTKPNESEQQKLRSQSARLRNFDEIMACRLRDEMNNELPRSASSDIAGGEQDDDVAQFQHDDEAELEDYTTESAPSTHRAMYSEGPSGRDYESSCSSSPYWKTYGKPEDNCPENEVIITNIGLLLYYLKKKSIWVFVMRISHSLIPVG